MNVTNLNNSLPFILLGDNHGNWNELFFQLNSRDVKDSYVFSVGDCGIGFLKKEQQLKQLKLLNEEFKSRNIFFKAIRGNHDNPFYFKKENKINLSNFELVEDYTVFSYDDLIIQAVGGATSIDRTGRQLGSSYWEDEKVVFNKLQCANVDILITHTAPSFCYPQKFNGIVYSWANEDAYLIEDLIDERAVMDEIFKLCNPKYHFYGHFHTYRSDQINNCIHRLLDIDELYELKVK